MRDIIQLGNSLGDKYSRLTNDSLFRKLKKEQKYLNWKVAVNDIIVLENPTEIPKNLFNTKNYRIVRPTNLNENTFNQLLELSRLNIVIEDEEAAEFPEGRIMYKLHKTKERNPAVIKIAKRNFIKKHGLLFCEICGFDFELKYGEIGKHFIEGHHTLPISKLSENETTRPTDIAMVCPNCHRMLHKRRPWLRLSELKALLK